MLPVLVEELELEGVRDRLRRDPGLGLGLEPADDQATDLLLEVGPAVGVTQDRQVPVDALDLVGHDVEVLRRVQRHPDPGERPDRLGPLPGAVDDDLALHVTVVGAHPAHPPPAGRGRVGDDVETGHPHAFPHLHPELAGPPRQGLGDVRGVHRPVAGEPDRAGQVVRAQQGVALPRLLGSQQLALEVVGGGGGRRPPERGHPVGGPGDDEPAARAVAGRETGLGLEPLVELRRVLHEARAALARPQQAHEARGVPRRPARQGPLLEEEHVGPAEVGEVVCRRRTDDAPADDDDAGTSGQGRSRVGSLRLGRRRWGVGLGHRPDARARRSSKRGLRANRSAGSSFSSDHPRKSKSIGLVASWMLPHRVQP